MRVCVGNNYSELRFGMRYKAKNILSQDELKLLAKYKTMYNYSDTKSVQWKTKRVLDFVLSLIGSILAAPVMLCSALAVKISSKGPVLFKQQRIGKNGNTFIIYKFRTMKNNPETDTNVQHPNDERITKVGKILRKYSLDELPQFFNILKGDMSLAGPRPIPIKDHQIRKTSDEFIMRYVFKPGASLDYHGNVSHFVDDNPEICNALEKEYIQNWNLKKDFKTYFSTLLKVFRGDNY